MRHLLILPVFCAALAAPFATPLAAQEAEAEEEGFSLMEEGAKLFLKGIIQEMEPAIDELNDLTAEMEPALRALVDEMGPAFMELLDKVDDITMYHAPEVLPNGDIILRRKQPDEVEPPAGEANNENGAIDL